MKEAFREHNPNKKTKERLDHILSIIAEYETQDIKLTERQLFYQLVSRNVVKNTLKSYKSVCSIITNGRYSGRIDWDAIEDRVRIPYRHSQFDGVEDLVESAIYAYRLDRWKGQEYYVELYTEKNALTSILRPLTDKYHIYLNVNVGYTSATAMYDASKRFLEATEDNKECILLYLGDHDPSGLDMVRDVRTRLNEFCEHKAVEVIPIALTYKQVKKHNLPPNFVKETDSRAGDYSKLYGSESWEVDALRPEILQELITDAIEKYRNVDLVEKVLEQEEDDKLKLEKYAKRLANASKK
ncbi:hypothetical protein LCGC14_1562930 [marine sediment metagenome]|uniref:Uncharacterized protein n=1 Tax=marine sediment metagenome TaxID=412755 RepID=A0A0F9J833_9ZZZZ